MRISITFRFHKFLHAASRDRHNAKHSSSIIMHNGACRHKQCFTVVIGGSLFLERKIHAYRLKLSIISKYDETLWRMIIYFLKFETEFFVLHFPEKKLFIGVVLLCGQTILIPLSCVHSRSHCLQFSNCHMQSLIGGYPDGIHWAVLRRFWRCKCWAATCYLQ